MRQRARADNYHKKQVDVSFPCVGPVIHDEFRHNIFKVAVDPRGDLHEKTDVIKVSSSGSQLQVLLQTI